MEFDDILDDYRSGSPTMRERGTRFEELVARYLMTDPTYSAYLTRVVPWNDFYARSDLGGGDTGIDLVGFTKDGEYWAIQCKCYAEEHQVSKADMDTFIATSGRVFKDVDGNAVQFSERLVVATTDNWSSNAVDVLNNQSIPAMMLTLSMLRDAPVDWKEIEEGVHGDAARKGKYTLRPHQQDAVDKAFEHYAHSDRGKMVMACGTGKTFTSLRIAESICNIAGGGD